MNKMKKKKYTLTALRMTLGWVFLWAFLDKTFGLGFTTESTNAWLNGGSPTTGFLTHATQGPFAEMFQMMAGLAVVDWLFMLGLLGIGVALILGVMMRLACWSGIALMMLMWLAVLPPEHNPVVDDHVIYSLALYYLFLVDAKKSPERPK